VGADYNKKMKADFLADPDPARLLRHYLPYLTLSLLAHALLLAWPRLGVLQEAVPPPVDVLAVSFVASPVPLPAVGTELRPAEPAPARPSPQRVTRTPRTTAVAVNRNDAPFAVSAAPDNVAAVALPVTTAGDGRPPAAPVLATAPRFNATYLHNPAPVYPPSSRRLGEEGKVLLHVKVSAAGQPVAVDLEKSSNFERLDEAARHAVARWRFVPAKRGEEAVEGSVIVPIVFRLDD
jgi:protein TonB